MRTPGASADRPAPAMHVLPLPVAIDEDPAFVEHAIQEKWRNFLDAIPMRNVDSASGKALEASDQVDSGGGAFADERHQQVEVGVCVLIAPRHRSVEHRQPNPTLGT
jgi:hypothetical protein